jgi:AmmeMemoRadiSam system protein A
VSSSGQFEEVVGYLSAAIVAGSKARMNPKSEIGMRIAKPDPDELTEDDKQLLKKIARDSIEHHMESRRYVPPQTERLEARRGAFVCVYVGDRMDGCMGQVRGRDPLYQSVADLAVAAAFEDPRFEPLQAADLPKLRIEISLLSRLERVKEVREIVVGRDGLMIRLDMHSGLLLPKVATEYNWNTETFLEQVCLKAGLPKNAYKDKAAEIYKFTADVF